MRSGGSRGLRFDGTAEARRRQAAVAAVHRALVHAEEKYLIAPGSTLGTWFARVHETIAVASRVGLARIEDGRDLAEDETASEQLGLYADICAEAIRAAARVWVSEGSSEAREQIIELVSADQTGLERLCWEELVICILRCCAALEPIANGLRAGDLPMGEPTDRTEVANCLQEVAGHAYRAAVVLC